MLPSQGLRRSTPREDSKRAGAEHLFGPVAPSMAKRYRGTAGEKKDELGRAGEVASSGGSTGWGGRVEAREEQVAVAVVACA